MVLAAQKRRSLPVPKIPGTLYVDGDQASGLRSPWPHVWTLLRPLLPQPGATMAGSALPATCKAFGAQPAISKDVTARGLHK